MTKIITKTDLFKKSILHRDTIINFEGEEKLKWFVNLNKIRNKASHPTREPIIENEYNFVFKLKEWLTQLNL
tara:strand:+ start:2994 stop:3209 length:216 start_codon:yes stop_codon:yes gene_type:complete